jgi:hypothetical protein
MAFLMCTRRIWCLHKVIVGFLACLCRERCVRCCGIDFRKKHEEARHSTGLITVNVPICSARSTKSTVTNRIVGGNAAFAGQFPYSAAIYKSTIDATFFCGGCLLNNEWIVTAGQCVDGALLFTIRLGTNNLNSNDPNALRLATDYYVLHPDFNTLTLENDVGLIKLRMPIEFTSYIRPIHYLPVGDLAPYTGTTGIGWGQVDDCK